MNETSVCGYCDARAAPGTNCRSCGAPVSPAGSAEIPPDELREICRRHEDGEKCRLWETLPEKRLDRAVQALEIPAGEIPVLFHDCTVLGSAKYGFAISDRGLRWKNDWSVSTTRRYLPWVEFCDRKIRRDGFTIDLGRGDRIDVAALGGDTQRDRVTLLLEEIRSRLQVRRDR